MAVSKNKIDGTETLTLGSDLLQTTIAPSLGGKIISVYNRTLQREFLWLNKNLSMQSHPAGSDYDQNFIGGIDELIPNDIPETVDSVAYPDHGELWTTPLDYQVRENELTVSGKLKLSGLHYRKTMSLDESKPVIHLHYQIKNESGSRRNFMWKLHAALIIEAGDRLVSPAVHAKVADPAYSRFSNMEEFQWPLIENTDAGIVPGKNNSVDFFYLYDLQSPRMQWLSRDKRCTFGYAYDPKVFPFQWYFASYGGFLDHYTAVLEPCSSMPISVNEAKEMKQCTILEPGETLQTSMQIFAGEINNEISENE
jgi:hypothetical protein